MSRVERIHELHGVYIKTQGDETWQGVYAELVLIAKKMDKDAEYDDAEMMERAGAHLARLAYLNLRFWKIQRWQLERDMDERLVPNHPVDEGYLCLRAYATTGDMKWIYFAHEFFVWTFDGLRSIERLPPGVVCDWARLGHCVRTIGNDWYTNTADLMRQGETLRGLRSFVMNEGTKAVLVLIWMSLTVETDCGKCLCDDVSDVLTVFCDLSDAMRVFARFRLNMGYKEGHVTCVNDVALRVGKESVIGAIAYMIGRKNVWNRCVHGVLANARVLHWDSLDSEMDYYDIDMKLWTLLLGLQRLHTDGVLEREAHHSMLEDMFEVCMEDL